MAISERGGNIDEFVMPKVDFKHILIVFGGPQGIEDHIECDSAITEADPAKVFTQYLEACPLRGSKSIRTEVGVEINNLIL
jgi:methyltransferase